MSSSRLLSSLRRNLSSVSGSSSVFDRALKCRQRIHALQASDEYDYLRIECADRMVDRLDDISRTFPVALELGSHRGHIAAAIRQRNGEEAETLTGGLRKLIQCDIANSAMMDGGPIEANGLRTEFLDVGMEEFDFNDEVSVDLVLSSLALHWVNDIPAVLKRIRKSLKPDGAYIGCMLGGSTLQELRHCFYLAEQERKGGVSPHCSPFVRPSDVAGLMQGAGFSLPTIDVDNITIAYPDVFTLMEHLQGQGEQMASLNRQYNVGRDSFLSMASIYQDLYGDGDGGVKATFQVVYMIGWSPHESQPGPLERGSARMSLKNVL